MNTHDSRGHHQALYRQGQACQRNLPALLDKWPVGENYWRVQFGLRSDDDQELIRATLKEAIDWVNAVGDYRALHDRRLVNDIVRRLKFATLEEDYRLNGVEDARMAIEEALTLLGRLPSPTTTVNFNKKRAALVADVMIVMAMNSEPEVEDVCETIKTACNECNLQAVRADDIPHSGLVVDVIRHLLTICRFVIVDLTWESPNVYWEAGLAEGYNKELIFVCKKGSKVHFDLAGNNILEYTNYSHLKRLIVDRVPNAA